MNDFFDKGIGPVQGLFGYQHLIFVILSLTIVFLTVFLLRKASATRIKRFLRGSFFVFLLLECLKIIWNLTVRENGQEPDRWVPLYYCSIYIYALALSSFANGRLKKAGDSFLFFGGVIGGSLYSLYPSSVLPDFPLLHVLTFHSLIYHSLFLATAVILVTTNYYQPSLKDFPVYFLSVMVITSLALTVNIIFKANLMFISDPGIIEPLKIIKNISGIMYTPVIIIGQNILGFFGGWTVYIAGKALVNACRRHRKGRNYVQ